MVHEVACCSAQDDRDSSMIPSPVGIPKRADFVVMAREVQTLQAVAASKSDSRHHSGSLPSDAAKEEPGLFLSSRFGQDEQSFRAHGVDERLDLFQRHLDCLHALAGGPDAAVQVVPSRRATARKARLWRPFDGANALDGEQ